MRLRHLVGMAAMTIFVSTAAEAAPIPLSYDITFDPEPDVLFDNVSPGACLGNTTTNVVTGQTSNACSTLTYTYTLPGFVSGTDSLFSGSLTLTFFDDPNDPGRNGKPETVNINLGGVLVASGLDIPTSPFTTNPFDVRAALASDGQLIVMLGLNDESEGNNDFYFESSRLIARGERSDIVVTQVPEPASMLLFGLALTGLAARRMRR